MNYKEIYDELRTVMWGDEFANTKSEDEIGIDYGYLISLYDPCHNSKGTIDNVYHQRVLRIFKKFADKLYLETKDEYVIKLLEEACIFTGEMWVNADMSDIMGTYDDPEYMFDSYDTESAKEPKPEEKYRLIIRRKNNDGSIEKEVKNYKFYEEARRDFDKEGMYIKEYLKLGLKESEDVEEVFKKFIKADDENHFENNYCEMIIEKREEK